MGVIIVLAIVATSIAVVDLLTPPRGNQQTTTMPFINQPVVDVIIPTLFRQQGSSSGNIPLNVTTGQNVSMTVNVYTTLSLNLKMQFEVLTFNGESTNTTSFSTQNDFGIVASFDPSTISIVGAGKGSSNVTITTSLARAGSYNTVITAVNIDNTSQYWGDIIKINVTP